MRLLDTYATNTGSKIDKPFIYTKYFPLPLEKYITLQAQTPYDSRNYSYWQEVLEIIRPYLSKENIHIVIDMDIEKQIFTVRKNSESESIFNTHTYFCEPDSDEESFIHL